ncbi:hypothetical protein PFISCL1PPCAC_17560, partial [Pristionchus fissidentatus]
PSPIIKVVHLPSPPLSPSPFTLCIFANMGKAFLAFLLISSTWAVIDAIGTKQNITVRGQLKCKNKNVGDTLVELWDKELKKDDLLKSFTTSSDGHFFIVGHETQISKIHPYIRVKHSCGAKPDCTRVTEIHIDQMWIGKQKDLAFINLEKGDSQDSDAKVVNKDECPVKG